MSISNILQANNFDVGDSLPQGLKNQFLVGTLDEPEWANRSYSMAIVSKNNALPSPNTGVGTYANVITGPTPEDQNLGGYTTGFGDNEVFARPLLGSTTTPVHRCIITLNASSVAPLIDVKFAIHSVLLGVLPTTETVAQLTPDLKTVVISARVKVDPLDTMSIQYKNLTDGSSITVKDMYWNIDFLGYE